MKRIVFLMLAVWAAVTRTTLAAAERPQVLAFGSSDSCEWCKLLEWRVFASTAWREWADAHVVFTRVDLPRRDGVLAPDVRERNNALADRLGVKGIPTFVVMAPDGETELGRVKVPDSARGLGRDMTPAAFIAALEDVLARDPPASVALERDPPARGLSVWRVYRFIPVVVLLGFAAYLLVDKSKLPLALRGLKKVLGTAATPREGAAPSAPLVSVWKRLLAFVLILIAFVLAIV